MSKLKIEIDFSKLNNTMEIELDDLKKEDILNKHLANTPFHFTELGCSIVDAFFLNQIIVKNTEFMEREDA